ncbi:MAG: AmmeMemoRadiSam system radical SAM enzyme [Bacillota bacterium]|nr:AmmeMemoRadiSam system radical SAM enzyme [Bacillota bacterium]
MTGAAGDKGHDSRSPVARWWRPLEGEEGDRGGVLCLLCPQECHIRPGGRGKCRYRRNFAGQLHATSYGRISAHGLDPIEKKPLYHFMPGSVIFSVGTVGCNLACGFCQNWQISQEEAETEYLSPHDAARLAGIEAGGCRRSVGLAYTYSEPLVWWEYVYDTALLVRQSGLANVLVTNGYVAEEPLRALLPLVDAMNVDVKAFTDDFYRDICRGQLAPVLRTVEMANAAGTHVEVTTLLVPGLNDAPEEVERLASWLAGVNPGIPLHFSRYFPNYRMREPGPTPAASLQRARDIARRHLQYVYIGNAFEVEAADTICPGCGAAVIRRDGYGVSMEGLREGACASCGRRIVRAVEPQAMSRGDVVN